MSTDNSSTLTDALHNLKSPKVSGHEWSADNPVLMVLGNSHNDWNKIVNDVNQQREREYGVWVNRVL